MSVNGVAPGSNGPLQTVVDGRAPSVVEGCWKEIGVQGDRSCPELNVHVHCRNCDIYAGAAARLLEIDSPADYVEEWTGYVAMRSTASESIRRSVLIFRIGTEWLALPSPVVDEVSDLRTVHSVPHRRRDTMLGLVNIRGELLVCMSLGRALGLDAPGGPSGPPGLVQQRMLVLRRNNARAVCAVDEVHGLHSFKVSKLKDVPATVARGAATHTTGVLEWKGRSVGMLDDQLVFAAFQRGLA
jgi:chemotaxis-related protein WspD